MLAQSLNFVALLKIEVPELINLPPEIHLAFLPGFDRAFQLRYSALLFVPLLCEHLNKLVLRDFLQIDSRSL